MRNRPHVAGASAGLLALLALAGCERDQPQNAADNIASNAAAAEKAARLSSVSVRAPDSFYDPPAQLPDKPGMLLRAEPLRDVTLPAGLRGWRIFYNTTINDRTPATAVAMVFAPVQPAPGPLPVITWEHGTTGVL